MNFALIKHWKYLSFILAVLVIGCAKRGTINGGLKDTLAPVLRASFPKNFSTGFQGKEIKLVFNEYIKLENINKQLIISPPMKYPPEITPLTASKTIAIKIKDTLRPDTTYSFNFGQSIEDNNEGNPYPQFKYVFSTGTFIDSLTLGGFVKDAYNKKADSYISVMLYDVGEKFNDSVVYKETPRYVTNTLDSATTFKLENLKAGKYMIVGMKDYNSNNKFDPKKDKIGFHKEFITIPNDTLYELELFKEVVPFKAIKPTLAEGSKLLMPYEGDSKGAVATLRNGTDIIPTLITQVQGKDSLHIWHQPIKVDSLSLEIAKGNYKQNFTVKIKPQKKDTLSFNARQSKALPFREKFTIASTRPLVKFDNSLMQLTNKDSAAVAFTTEYDERTMELKYDFVKEPLQTYKLQLLPGAVTDFYGVSNDSLKFTTATRNTTDYGNLTLTLQNVRQFPIIIELLNPKGEVLANSYSESLTTIEFASLEPSLYTIRIIYDENKNQVWDTGSFIEKRQSEEVIYNPKEIDVRANWDLPEVFTLP